MDVIMGLSERSQHLRGWRRISGRALGMIEEIQGMVIIKSQDSYYKLRFFGIDVKFGHPSDISDRVVPEIVFEIAVQTTQYGSKGWYITASCRSRIPKSPRIR